uniref:Histone acetyltransferase KAT2A n=1 Tax=Melanaphis sacchari TaxID=742174 RepID=A0A2H8TLU0_9HEMI
MGNSFSCGYPMFCNRHRQVEPKELLLMNNIWKTNDILYKRIRMEREKLEDKKSGSLVRIVAEFSPCKASGCRCKKGVFDEVECDNHGWKNSICTRAGCKHPLSDHASHVMSATRTEFAATIKVVFDIINIKGTLENTSKKPKTERIILVEDVFVSIYHVLLKTLRYDPFTAPNIDKIYGTPPFEKTNINQILLNFCVQKFGKKNSVLIFIHNN